MRLRWFGPVYVYRDRAGMVFVGRQRRDGSLVDVRIK